MSLLDYKVQALVGDFNPFVKVQDAMMVLKRLEETHCITLRTPFVKGDRYFAGANPHGTSGWNGRPDIQASGKTMEEAICNLALEFLNQR